MFNNPATTDPQILAEHIAKCTRSFKDGALAAGGVTLVAFGSMLFSCSDIKLLLAGAALAFTFLFLPAQIWAKVLRSGIKPPTFSFVGDTQFAVIGLGLNLFINLAFYVFGPLVLSGVVGVFIYYKMPILVTPTAILCFVWPFAYAAYILVQRARLKHMVAATSPKYPESL